MKTIKIKCQICGQVFETQKRGNPKYCKTCRPIARYRRKIASAKRRKAGEPSQKKIRADAIQTLWMHWILKLAGHACRYGTPSDEQGRHYARMAALTYKKNKI